MRILHFADLHIGVENYGRTDPATFLSTRLLDFLQSLDQLVEYALEYEVDIVILAGDAYKNRDPSQTQQRELARRLTKLSQAGIPTFLLVGNHDLPNALGRATAIDIYDTLQIPLISVGDNLQTYIISTDKGPIQIVALPWPRKSKLLSIEDTKGMSIDELNLRIQNRLSAGIRQLAQDLDPKVPAILAGHVTVHGAKLGSERTMMLGQDHHLLISDLHLPQFDYVALGHIHKHQVLRKDPMIVYSGSLERVDFGEENDDKGFCVVDLDTDGPQGKRLTNFQFKKVAARRFLTIEILIPDETNEPTDYAINEINNYSIQDAIIRVKLNLNAKNSTLIRESDLRKALSPAHYIASITRDVAEERRTRIPPDLIDGLSTMKALEMYLDNKKTKDERKTKLLDIAQKLIREDESQPQ
jgi:exonuclease SbcD